MSNNNIGILTDSRDMISQYDGSTETYFSSTRDIITRGYQTININTTPLVFRMLDFSRALIQSIFRRKAAENSDTNSSVSSLATDILTEELAEKSSGDNFNDTQFYNIENANDYYRIRLVSSKSLSLCERTNNLINSINAEYDTLIYSGIRYTERTENIKHLKQKFINQLSSILTESNQEEQFMIGSITTIEGYLKIPIDYTDVFFNNSRQNSYSTDRTYRYSSNTNFSKYNDNVNCRYYNSNNYTYPSIYTTDSSSTRYSTMLKYNGYSSRSNRISKIGEFYTTGFGGKL